MTASTTDKIRLWNVGLFTVAIVVALGGWLLGKDPGQLGIIIPTLATAIGIGEASAVGKRATFKKEALPYVAEGDK